MNTPEMLDLYRSGSTEPWTADLLHALIRALQPQRLLELGSFLGLTTRRLADAMGPNASLVAVECDIDRHRTTQLAFGGVAQVQVVHEEALAFLRSRPEPFDFVFVDDDHSVQHVAAELDLLLVPVHPLVNPIGLVAVHDVDGPFNLAGVVVRHHGWILHLPKLHVAGGLGLIQRGHV